MGYDDARRWAANLLENPMLRKQLCSQFFRQHDLNANGLLENSELSALSSSVNMQLGLPDFDTSLLDESLERMGKPAGSPLTPAEFQTFYELCLRVFLEPQASSQVPEVSLEDREPVASSEAAPETQEPAVPASSQVPEVSLEDREPVAASEVAPEPQEPAVQESLETSELTTKAGGLERRGLHMWNFSWYPIYAELRGSDLHVLDTDKVSLGVVALAGQFTVQRQGDCNWRLLPDGDSVLLPDLLAYEWRAESKTEADDWDMHLSKACEGSSTAGKVAQTLESLSTTASSLAAAE
eukprot:TRINITY_DN1630_c0_g1_i1.p1 TRINITY_DN1630_c0_g1~~TRINITY_DN1630_c0_g1_i1.p1  ORF type:complete len:296 (+),score=70.41 TRINITY_DN1630_c0_g1_i1:71-958(+)